MNSNGYPGDRAGVVTATATPAVTAEAGKQPLGWGKNDDYQQGTGNQNGSSTPQKVKQTWPDDTTFIDIAGSDYHGLALTHDGLVYSWGRSSFGEGGDGDVTDHYLKTPTPVVGLSGATAIGASVTYSVAVVSDRQVLMAWGYGPLLGTGNDPEANHATPVAVKPTWPKGTRFKDVTCGPDFSLALTDDGQVWAWGPWSIISQNSSTPVQVPNLSNVTAIARGYVHALALSGGSVYAWGVNNDGDLGNTGDDTSTPVKVEGLPDNIIAIGAGDLHSLAVGSDGTVWAWGSNRNGQLGDPTIPTFNGSTATPVKVQGLPANATFTTVAGGGSHSLISASDGTAYGWGYNYQGQVGNGQPGGYVLTATPVSGTGPAPAISVTAVAAMSLWSLAISDPTQAPPKKKQKEFSWGHDDKGQLGNGYADADHDESAPKTMALSGALEDLSFSYTAAGWYHSLAVTDQGDIYACGFNDAGQLGNNDPSNTDSSTLQKVQGLDVAIAKVAGGEHHSLALARDGSTVYAWGANGSGQLGIDKPGARKTPEPVLLPAGTYTAIAAGEYHSLALSEDGTVWAWGSNYYGNLGTGGHDPGKHGKPVQVTGKLAGKKVIAIAAGAQHSLAATDNGEVYAWGFNIYGQLGDGHHGTGTDSYTPVPVQGLPADTVFTAVAGGQGHSLACSHDGQVWAWGQDTYGQLGDDRSGYVSESETALSDTAVRVRGLDSVAVTGIAAGGMFSMAIDATTGKAHSWGRNKYGQLGIGQPSEFETTAQEVKQDGITFAVVGAGIYHSLAC